GKNFRRIDMMAKSTGTQSYGIDLRFENMLYATVRTNPGMGGEMLSYDATAAEKMRGVKTIGPITNGIAVVADNTWRAFQAAKAVTFEWGPAPYPATSAEMWEKLNEAIDNEEFQDSQMRNDGDVEAAQKGADVLEAEFRTPLMSHAPMEPMNATVLVEDGQVQIWTGTQIPAWVRDNAAKITGVPADSIFVYNQPMGGSFGRRLEDTYVQQAVEAAMLVKGTPVKMIRTREEDMSHDYPRPMQLGRLRGTVKDGKVESLDVSISTTSIARSWFGRVWQAPPGPDSAITLGTWDQPYGVPNYRTTAFVAAEMVPISSWRAPARHERARGREPHRRGERPDVQHVPRQLVGDGAREQYAARGTAYLRRLAPRAGGGGLVRQGQPVYLRAAARSETQRGPRLPETRLPSRPRQDPALGLDSGGEPRSRSAYPPGSHRRHVSLGRGGHAVSGRHALARAK
ncbi:MAG: molybdopterin cofactor-binding domain-containing protein, partial [Myxococcota bacterium]